MFRRRFAMADIRFLDPKYYLKFEHHSGRVLMLSYSWISRIVGRTRS